MWAAAAAIVPAASAATERQVKIKTTINQRGVCRGKFTGLYLVLQLLRRLQALCGHEGVHLAHSGGKLREGVLGDYASRETWWKILEFLLHLCPAVEADTVRFEPFVFNASKDAASCRASQKQ